jgi:hypothetical protein
MSLFTKINFKSLLDNAYHAESSDTVNRIVFEVDSTLGNLEGQIALLPSKLWRSLSVTFSGSARGSPRAWVSIALGSFSPLARW